MSLTVHAMRGGENEYQETADGMSLLWYLMFSQGVPLKGTVVDSSPDTGYFAVQAQSTPNKTVKVKAGYMLVKATPTSETERMFIANLSADSNVTIADNTSGSPKYDKVYLYLPADALHDPETDGNLTETACLLTERHDAANEALTATNAIELAEITVANGFTEIADAVIADRRVFSSLLPKGDWQNMVGAVTCGADNVLTISGTEYVSSVAVGDKIWVKDDGTDWMGYVRAKDATTATVIGGTTAGAAATIASGSKITNARFSKGNPVGFPHRFTWVANTYKNDGTTASTETINLAEFWMQGAAVKGTVNISGIEASGGTKIWFDLPVATTAVNANRAIGAGYGADATDRMAYAQIPANATTKAAVYQYGEDVWDSANANAFNINFEYTV